MSHDIATPRRESLRSLTRDVVLLVSVGIALGLGANAILLRVKPSRALSWVKPLRSTTRLEYVAPVKQPLDAVRATPAKRVGAPAARDPHAASLALGAPVAAGRGPVTAARPGARAVDEKPAPAAVTTPAPALLSEPAATVAPAARAPGVPESRDPFEAQLPAVRALHDAGAATFLDARSAEEYAAGHIAGAVSMPSDDVFKDATRLDRIGDPARPVVTYCDGGDCNLARDLAFMLIDKGHRRVVVFTEGLPAWRSAGLPLHTGAQP